MVFERELIRDCADDKEEEAAEMIALAVSDAR
jgi:hypothetical protein